jgi:hypothetical protein
MEKGETLTTTIAPGTYHVRATGKVSTLDCWARDDTLVVPPGGKPVVRTLGLTHVNMPGC